MHKKGPWIFNLEYLAKCSLHRQTEGGNRGVRHHSTRQEHDDALTFINHSTSEDTSAFPAAPLLRENGGDDRPFVGESRREYVDSFVGDNDWIKDFKLNEIFDEPLASDPDGEGRKLHAPADDIHAHYDYE